MPVKKSTATSKRVVKKKTVSKPKTATKKSTTKVEPLKPRIRIQKVPGLSPVITNRDLVVDLKKNYPSAKTESLKVFTPPKADKHFYTDEEDDSLGLPETVVQKTTPTSLNEAEAEDDDLEDTLSLGDIDDKDNQAEEDYDEKSTKTSVKDYALQDKSDTDNKKVLTALYDQSDADKSMLHSANKKSIMPTPNRLYQRLAWAFAAVVVIIVGIIFYFSSVKTKISISLKNENLNQQLSFILADATASSTVEGQITALVKEVSSEQSKVFPVLGTEVIGEEVSGQITLINTYNKNQPLVAKTRLLSASGKLYRLRNAVNIPAGGQVVAQVYADQNSQDMVVGAEKFTIPGLWEGLQDKIYAQSSEGSIKYGQQTKKVVTKEALDQAVATLSQEIVDKIKADIDNTYSDNNQRLVEVVPGVTTSSVNAVVGEELDEFTVVVKTKVRLVSFKDDNIKQAVNKRLTALLPANQQLLSIKNDSLSYAVAKWADDSRSVEVNVTLSAEIGLVSGVDLIDRKKIVNLSDAQLKLYLDGLPEIKSYTVEYSPAFIKKTSGLADRIEIKIVE
ncbi:hypothetical protein COT94_03320 [Candidatus Falkowbacteria bacterium CG10_big_fil_rev_8_21_14_0_10_37_14]|uniref:Baseplate protein J-like domain-containing protein n=1 Tax=Candidatus Falkowbacteria bacterium CG10_big_fil_rev_8_21_14_0_10_37_14 TaxID=1974561 RepID=A0A2M6WSS4_9BACT|nr:hypothetical protein [Candidatus Falkowbacteria bacterium]PIT95850.1 MAG: hypothetical protein COT94_03320 [Candidatus Falkowbacteria bacterium CG10_big_fil_rev_8_21_14_0_10_37_14]